MQVKAPILLLSVALAALAAGCDLLGNDRIGEEQAVRYAEANRGLAATLPVPPKSRLVSEEQYDCTGAYRHEKAACSLDLTYETTAPLSEAMAFYDKYFMGEAWTPHEIDPEVNTSYRNAEFAVQIFLRTPPGLCPDAGFDPEGNRRCKGQEIRRDDGRSRTFDLSIGPG